MKGSKLCYKLLQKLGGGEGVSVMLLRNSDKILYMRKAFWSYFVLTFRDLACRGRRK